MTPRRWFHGLAAAFIGGAATFLSSGQIIAMMAPETFNFGPQLSLTLKTMAVLGAWAGLQTALAFLKQAPLPEWERRGRKPGPPEPSVKMEKKTETVTVSNPQLLGPEVVAQVTEKP